MNNKQASSILVNRYLLAPDDVLKNIEKEYNKRAKSKRFYDYYEAVDILPALNGEDSCQQQSNFDPLTG